VIRTAVTSDSLESDASAPLCFVVDDASSGHRLDRFLVDNMPELSRARARMLLDSGNVRVDGRRARKGDSLSAGTAVVVLEPPPPRDFTPIANAALPWTVRLETPEVAVVEKPAGMPTHPLRADETDTLANAIVSHYPETAEIGFARREPGLMHRLDTDTSGVVLVARTREAFESLRQATRDGAVTKRYVALVRGRVEADGRVEYPLVPHRKDPKRVEAVTPHVRLRAGTKVHEAITRYKPGKSFSGVAGEDVVTWIDVEITRAFRHQIRVHLATIGHALVGDALYRGPDGSAIGLSRHFLHASAVSFPHPRTGARTEAASPLPPDLTAVIAQLTVVP